MTVSKDDELDDVADRLLQGWFDGRKDRVHKEQEIKDCMKDELFVKAKRILKRRTTDALQLKSRLPFAKEIKYENFVKVSSQIVSALRKHG